MGLGRDFGQKDFVAILNGMKSVTSFKVVHHQLHSQVIIFCLS